jgi:hypothetical protein
MLVNYASCNCTLEVATSEVPPERVQPRCSYSSPSGWDALEVSRWAEDVPEQASRQVALGKFASVVGVAATDVGLQPRHHLRTSRLIPEEGCLADRAEEWATPELTLPSVE